MTTIHYNQLEKQTRFFGRTFADDSREAVFINWTCAGFEVAFTGSVLRAEILSLATPGPTPPGPVPVQTEIEYPWIGIFVDGSDEPSARVELRESKATYTLFESGSAGQHTVKVVKLSENMRGQAGLSALETDGTFETVPANTKPIIEFIGDSITCGFGNESQTREGQFKTGEENGWITYGALAARKLGAEARFICVSGIAVSHGKNPMPFMKTLPSMELIYEKADGVFEMKNGLTENRMWDFNSHKSDVVVLNLGTNDSNIIRFSRNMDNKAEEEAFFAVRYRRFIETVRKCNGPDTLICCGLGPMDHYLYDVIKDTVRDYAAQTGDKNIMSFKFCAINIMTEGFGGLGHPSAKTHARMAEELYGVLHDKLSSR